MIIIYLLYTNTLAFISLAVVGFLYYIVDDTDSEKHLVSPINIPQPVNGSKIGAAETGGKIGTVETGGKIGTAETGGKNVHKTENYILRALHSHGYGGFTVNNYPEWLVIQDEVSGKEIQLELDFLDSENNVAIEYNGPQHYHFIPKHWNDFYDYAKYVKNSIAKEEICQQNGVELITVPYTVPMEQLYDYIKSRFWDNRYIRDRYGINKPKQGRYIPEKIVRIDKLDIIMEGVVSRDLGEIITS